MGARGEQIALVLNGRKGQFMATSVMPAQNTLSDTDIAAAITYSRNAWGNKAKEDMVTPVEVKAARK